jgi:hypothetical protein
MENNNSRGINWKELTPGSFLALGSRFDLSINSLGMATLMRQILVQEEGFLTEMEEAGDIKEDEEDENGLRYIKKMEKLGGRLIHQNIGDGFYTSIFIWKHGLVNVNFSGTYLKVGALSQDEKFVRTLQQDIVKEFLPPVQIGHIFAITKEGPHLGLSSIGNASIPLEAGNYTSKVLEDYRFVIKDLQSDVPSGRITIMEGVPGSGKTHLVRAMLTEVPDAMFVLVDPSMVDKLAGPELLPLLTRYKASYAMSGPIVLVLEDADRCLVTRGEKNINSIQSLLNLGDGILGSLLDLRIVATTNAQKMEMEAAILRPGRLSKRLEVGALDMITARGVFRRLLPNATFTAALSDNCFAPITLAQVYAEARKAGWQPVSRKKKQKKNNPSSKYDNYDD